MNHLLKAENLRVSVENKEIIRGLDLEVGRGEFHVVMGPNGSGKSTLALAIVGHPKYRVSGSLLFEGEDIKELSVDERARKGIFLAFQHPEEVDGVRIIDYLRLVLEKVKGVSKEESYRMVFSKAKEVNLSESDLNRYINVGFSGGERKRLEILQALLLEPKLVILDEPDSGVDIDSLSLISSKLNEIHENGEAVLLITHYGRILKHVDPKTVRVHIMKDGRIVMSGGEELVEKIENDGFAKVFEECGCNE
jgi:Fe-S cluster assembly ATP-binding protein